MRLRSRFVKKEKAKQNQTTKKTVFCVVVVYYIHFRSRSCSIHLVCMTWLCQALSSSLHCIQHCIANGIYSATRLTYYHFRRESLVEQHYSWFQAAIEFSLKKKVAVSTPYMLVKVAHLQTCAFVYVFEFWMVFLCWCRLTIVLVKQSFFSCRVGVWCSREVHLCLRVLVKKIEF